MRKKIYLCPDQDDEIGGGWGKASARYLKGKETIILYDNILDASCDISEIKGIVYGFIHEVGHWLNLRHIWGDNNCGNDYCDDTPIQEEENYNS